jgi:ribulose-phosphate 3-epimerase
MANLYPDPQPVFQVAPSILSADFCNLQSELELISNADWVHIDVMDNHFVPNLTIGQPVVKRIIEVAGELAGAGSAVAGSGAGAGAGLVGATLQTDVHLMIENPDRWAIDFAAAGADSVTMHYGAASAPIRLARELRANGVKAAIALRPAESAEPLLDILDEFDMILVMTVEPGFGGQKFLANQLAKVRRLREAVQKLPADVRPLIQVDGGVSRDTVALVAEAGANIAVAGNAVYGAANPREEIALIRALGGEAFAKAWG